MMLERDIIDQAIAWRMREPELDADGWRALVAWLDAPAHADAYDAVALDHALIAEASNLREAVNLRDAEPAPAAQPVTRYRPGSARWMAGAGAVGAIAAAVAVMFVLPNSEAPKSAPYEVATAAGQRQSVTLADGTRIELSGGTRVQLDRADPRAVALLAGEAVFHVRHDEKAPFTLAVGDWKVRDIGTMFNVERNGGAVKLQVGEGAVALESNRQSLRLTRGGAVAVQRDLASATIFHVAPESVGSWREQRLSFSGDTLGEAAARIGRIGGADIRVSQQLIGKPFTGMIHLTGEAGRDVPYFATLVGAKWRRNGDQWILSPADTVSR